MVRLSSGHVKKLQGKRLNILFDQDKGGYVGLQFIKNLLPESQLKVLALTPGARDFDEEEENNIREYMDNLEKYDIRKILHTK